METHLFIRIFLADFYKLRQLVFASDVQRSDVFIGAQRQRLKKN